MLVFHDSFVVLSFSSTNVHILEIFFLRVFLLCTFNGIFTILGTFLSYMFHYVLSFLFSLSSFFEDYDITSFSLRDTKIFIHMVFVTSFRFRRSSNILTSFLFFSCFKLKFIHTFSLFL